MKARFTTLTFLTLTFVAGSAFPIAHAEGLIAQREENQQKRIGQGIDSGQLTAGEAARLEKGEQKLEQARQKALSDGKMTWPEKKRLTHRENKLSHRIYHFKHNPRKA